MAKLHAVVFSLVIASFLLTCASSSKCNKVFCASVVSKCMLTQACKCDLTPDKEKCSCCVDCAKCLGKYYQQCCTCLGMCDEEALDVDPNDSQVGDFADPFPQLFEAVTLEKETAEWVVFTYPADLPVDELAKKHNKNKYQKENFKNDALLPLPRIGVNCTVVFMSQCHSASKCREACKLIGSASYRFFFNGCCECVGPVCLNYGINESRCPLCSDLEDVYDHHYMMDDPTAINELENDIIP